MASTKQQISDDLADSAKFHFYESKALAECQESLMRLVTSHSHPAWRYIQAIAQERAKHDKSFKEILEELTNLSE